uniref:Uncharacterized protein n=1 Tax=Nelumbo nucifera TaxID=4432 RepID=A0A822Z5G8_NELNU|nr:TPA_asm: hypothetical protein HUJ06_014410 [Nelumbo nucifera]
MLFGFCLVMHFIQCKLFSLQRYLVELICSFFVASWTGVVKCHGPRPSMRPKQVFVANYTSMIDFIVLEQMTAFAVIMQKHPRWVVFFATWFSLGGLDFVLEGCHPLRGKKKENKTCQCFCAMMLPKSKISGFCIVILELVSNLMTCEIAGG